MALARPIKITFAEMREQNVRGVLVYCADYHCSHSLAFSGDARPEDVRLSDIEPRFVQGLRQARRGWQAGLQLEEDACAPDWLSLKYHRRLSITLPALPTPQPSRRDIPQGRRYPLQGHP
jgi:hypothetical protein